MRKKNAEVKITTLFGAEAECTGDFSSKGSVRLDGRVNGDVNVAETLIIGATGSVSGDITAQAVIVGGEVLGDICASEKAELTQTARVLGDITTKVIVIDENAVFQGRIDMNQEVPGKRVKPSAKAVRASKKSAKEAIAEALKEVQEAENKEAVSEEKAPSEYNSL